MKLFSKVKLYFHSMFSHLYFEFVYLDKKNSYLSKDSKYVVSLTSYTKRIGLLHLTLKSILLQSLKPRKIYVWLSLVDFPGGKLPRKLSILSDFGVSFKFVDENIRSFKKIIYTYKLLENDLDKFIVTADDDVFYPKDWLKGFDDKCSNDNNNVYCYRGHSIKLNDRFTLSSYRNWTLCHHSKPAKSLLPTGVSGVCYPVNSLKGVDDYSFLTTCPTADDIWLKFITTKNGYKSSLVCNKSIHFYPVFDIIGLPQKGLESDNVFNDINTQAFINCLEYFNMDLIEFSE